MITSKSLHHANIALIFNERTFTIPENAELMALYRGADAKGARLVDDSVLRAKVFTFPAIQTRFTIEGSRLRVDDESGAELPKSHLAKNASHTYETLFRHYPLNAWGINMDIYFRTQNLIRIHDLFSVYFGDEALAGADLLDTGIQFTLRRKKFTEVWFIKITGPLEVAVHINRHFTDSVFPNEKGIQEAFEKCYTETDKMMEQFVYA